MYSLPGQQRQVSIWFRDLESGGIQLVKLDTKTKVAGIASKFVERGAGDFRSAENQVSYRAISCHGRSIPSCSSLTSLRIRISVVV